MRPMSSPFRNIAEPTTLTEQPAARPDSRLSLAGVGIFALPGTITHAFPGHIDWRLAPPADGRLPPGFLARRGSPHRRQGSPLEARRSRRPGCNGDHLRARRVSRALVRNLAILTTPASTPSCDSRRFRKRIPYRDARAARPGGRSACGPASAVPPPSRPAREPSATAILLGSVCSLYPLPREGWPRGPRLRAARELGFVGPHIRTEAA